MTRLLSPFFRHLLLALVLISVGWVAAPETAQAATSAQILSKVKEQAISDASSGVPMQASKIADHYRHNSAGLSTTLISIIYTREYRNAKGQSLNPKKPTLNLEDSNEPNTNGESFSLPNVSLPNLNSAGVITPILLIVLLVIIFFAREILLDMGGRFLAIATSILSMGKVRQRGGRRLLKAYRRVLLRSYSKVKLFRRTNSPMDMVSNYIGLRLRGLPDEETMKFEDAVQHYRRILILGAPGAGKSLALQRLALRSADPRLDELPDEALPILLPLHRMNGAPMPLRKMMAERLRLQKVRGAAALVNRGLLEGNLILLLDGLDEVSQFDRNHVLVDIKTLLGRFPDVRCVITCRKSSYNNELRGVVDATGELMGFNDQDVSTFLHDWAGTPDTEKLETNDVPEPEQHMPCGRELLSFINEHHGVRNLASNPMMLNLLAFIRDSTQTLNVTTRFRYLSEATDILLSRDIGENLRYTHEQKFKLLAHMARLLQDRGAREGADLFSMDRKEASLEVASAIPRLTKASDAKALIDEIVSQSGLLWVLNGGNTLKFAHPTLQHYFAAASLKDNAEGLLIRFRSDPGAWRESVKIWCGLVDTPDKVIETVMRLEPATAVACQAEARSAVDGLPPGMLDNLIG